MNGIPRFFMWVSGSWHADMRLQLHIVEVHPEATRLPQHYDADEVKLRLYQSKKLPWDDIEADAERAERVCERLNRSTLAVAAVEQERGGIKKLFKQCWQEDEQQYG